MIKNLPKIVIQFLTTNINFCLKYQYFPSTWKSAKVIRILKNRKDPKKPDSYRPITL